LAKHNFNHGLIFETLNSSQNNYNFKIRFYVLLGLKGAHSVRKLYVVYKVLCTPFLSNHIYNLSAVSEIPYKQQYPSYALRFSLCS